MLSICNSCALPTNAISSGQSSRGKYRQPSGLQIMFDEAILFAKKAHAGGMNFFNGLAQT